jgi:hypothetical protein
MHVCICVCNKSISYISYARSACFVYMFVRVFVYVCMPPKYLLYALCQASMFCIYVCACICVCVYATKVSLICLMPGQRVCVYKFVRVCVYATKVSLICLMPGQRVCVYKFVCVCMYVCMQQKFLFHGRARLGFCVRNTHFCAYMRYVCAFAYVPAYSDMFVYVLI